MASIPPTEAAAHEHFLLVYHRIQQWHDNQLNPEQWGWKSSRNGLILTSTAKAPAPDKLRRKVSCKCKGDCRGSCGCRRVGLYCSRLCTICEGNCLNVDNSCDIDNEGDPDDPPPVESPPTILETSAQGSVIGPVIFMHTPPFVSDPKEPDTYFSLVKAEREKLLEKFVQAGVKYVFCGHLQKNAGGKYEGLEVITTTAIGGQLGPVKSGFRVVSVSPKDGSIQVSFHAKEDS